MSWSTKVILNNQHIEYCFTFHQLIYGYVETVDDNDEIDRNPDVIDQELGWCLGPFVYKKLLWYFRHGLYRFGVCIMNLECAQHGLYAPRVYPSQLVCIWGVFV